MTFREIKFLECSKLTNKCLILAFKNCYSVLQTANIFLFLTTALSSGFPGSKANISSQYKLPSIYSSKHRPARDTMHLTVT